MVAIQKASQGFGIKQGDAQLESTPKVSILTPSYNQATFIEASIRSVLEQDYSNTELLILDGGSSDGSVDIIRAYSERIAYWVSQRGLGQAAALNEGIIHAQGSIVGWLNTDDIYLPGAITKVVEFFKGNPDCIMVYGDCRVIDKDGAVVSSIHAPEFSMCRIMGRNPLMQTSAFFRRDLFDQVGTFDVKLRYAIDYDLWLRAGLMFENRIKHLPQMLACYRSHPGAQSARDGVPALLEEIAVREKFASRSDLPEPIAALRSYLFVDPFKRLLLMASSAEAQPPLFDYLRSRVGYTVLAQAQWDALGDFLSGAGKTHGGVKEPLDSIRKLQNAWMRHYGGESPELEEGELRRWLGILALQSGHKQFNEGHSCRALQLGIAAVKRYPKLIGEMGTLILFAKAILGKRIFALARSVYRKLRR